MLKPIDMNQQNIISIAQVYDQEAEQYDADYDDKTTLGCNNIVMGYIRRELENLLVNRRSNRKLHVLDQGCGTGIVPRSIPELQNGYVRYVGIDVSQDMLAEASKHLPNHVSFREADMHNVDFIEDASIDLLLSIYGPFSYSLNPEALIVEKARIMRPGARMMVMPYTARVGSKILTGFSTAHNPITKKLFYTESLIRNLLEKDGYFMDVEVIGINFLGLYRSLLTEVLQKNRTTDALLHDRKLLKALRKKLALIDKEEKEWNKKLDTVQNSLHQFNSKVPIDAIAADEYQLGFDYLKRETELAKDYRIEAGMARFMLVSATRTEKLLT